MLFQNYLTFMFYDSNWSYLYTFYMLLLSSFKTIIYNISKIRPHFLTILCIILVGNWKPTRPLLISGLNCMCLSLNVEFTTYLYILLSKESFNNYTAQILTKFNPSSPLKLWSVCGLFVQNLYAFKRL